MRKLELAARGLERSGTGRLTRLVGGWSGVVALAYHRIGEARNSPFDRALWSATPAAFDAQVRFAKANFDVIRPCELHEVMRDGRTTRGRYVLITFDDGYRDNFEQAFPILRAHGVPATFFVTTGFLDRPGPAWWDEIAWMVRTSPRTGLCLNGWLREPLVFDDGDEREPAIRALLKVWKSLAGNVTTRFLNELAGATGSGRLDPTAANSTWMTWNMVRELKSAGMSIGGHTVNHPVLANLALTEQEREIAGCADRIHCETGEPMTCFSYPVGRRDTFGPELGSVFRSLGVAFAFSYYGGFGRPRNWNPYDIRRVAVEMDMSPELFRATLTLPSVFA